MIWHIFRKDWKLLWPMVAGAAAMNVAAGYVRLRALVYPEGQAQLEGLSSILQFLSFLATAFLIALVVHQDNLPGLRQDWLTRPIRRRDLALSKLLFVALLAQVPIFVVEFVVALAAELPLGISFSAAFWRSFWMLLAFDLPLMALAAITRNLVQTVAAALAAVLGFVGLAVLLFGNPFPYEYTGVAWIFDLFQTIWGFAAAAVVLALMYRRRKTTTARWAFGACVLVWPFLQFVPWKNVFAMQKQFSRQRGNASAVQLVFDSSRPKRLVMQDRPGIILSWRGAEPGESVALPVRIDGLGERGRLEVDNYVTHFIPPDGPTSEFEIIPRLRAPEGYDLIEAPAAVYGRIKDQRIRLQIDYSLTLLEAAAPQALPASGSTGWMDGLGNCRMATGRTGVPALDCVAPWQGVCTGWEIDGRPTQKTSTGANPCLTDYAPFATWPGDLLKRSSFFVPPGQQIGVLSYHPVAHFTTTLVIPDIRLSDWK